MIKSISKKAKGQKACKGYFNYATIKEMADKLYLWKYDKDLQMYVIIKEINDKK